LILGNERNGELKESGTRRFTIHKTFRNGRRKSPR
jgi:hypothetical protein